MKPSISFVLLLSFGLLFSQCSFFEAALPQTAKASGQWSEALGKGGGDNASPRNHYYTFNVKGNNKTVNIAMNADIDAGFSVYDPLGQQVVYSYVGRELTNDITLNEGQYAIRVFCNVRDGIGSYTLNLTGASKDLTRIPFQRLKTQKMTFSADGGGGVQNTFRNHYYRFETTEDKSNVDVSLDIAVNNGFFTLYNQLGEQVAYSYAGRSQWVVRELPKGLHTILVGTEDRDALNSTYELNVFGKVQNLVQVPFQSETIKSSWANSQSVNTYTLQVTEDNSILDVALKSPDINGYFIVLDPVGNQIAYSYSGRNQYTINAVNKGTYSIKTYPNQSNGKGNYSLIIYGQFTGLKKL